jgi:hypothetical protein
MKIQALDIQIGDRIVTYFNAKRQICTVKYILEPDRTNITLSVFIGDRYRYSASRIVRFHSDALVDLAK